MMGAHAFGRELGLSHMSHATAIAFVVDDDVSMRESLELLIRSAGWEPQTFASALEFLARPRALDALQQAVACIAEPNSARQALPAGTPNHR